MPTLVKIVRFLRTRSEEVGTLTTPGMIPVLLFQKT